MADTVTLTIAMACCDCGRTLPVGARALLQDTGLEVLAWCVPGCPEEPSA